MNPSPKEHVARFPAPLAAALALSALVLPMVGAAAGLAAMDQGSVASSIAGLVPGGDVGLAASLPEGAHSPLAAVMGALQGVASWLLVVSMFLTMVSPLISGEMASPVRRIARASLLCILAPPLAAVLVAVAGLVLMPDPSQHEGFVAPLASAVVLWLLLLNPAVSAFQLWRLWRLTGGPNGRVGS